MLYLLHFDRLQNGKQHYLGYCRDGRLLDRMAEHAAGRGAAFTRWMMQSGNNARVARIWHRAGRDAERRLKTVGHLKRRCPLCTPGLDSFSMCEEIVIRPNLPPDPGWSGLGWG